MNNLKKVLLVGAYNLTHYRIGMFNLLASRFDLTVAHSGAIIDGTNFKQISIGLKKKGPFFYLQKLPELSGYDVVILPFNIRIFNIYKSIFFQRKYKLILFGIGVSASYNNSYDQRKMLDFIRTYLIKKSDGVIFYEKYPMIKYQSFNIDPNKMHVAYNTVLAPTNFSFHEKTYENFIFIGSLYKQKKIYDLLNAYLKLCKKIKSNAPKLEIIGMGEEYLNIKNWITNKELESQIILHGNVTDEVALKPIFKRAIACISPGQAGLSVQKCFSYGVPFITAKKAITGGELFSIINNENGYLYDGSINELYSILYNISTKKTDIKEVSRKAYAFYNDFRNPKIWVAAFEDAIGLAKD